MQQLHKYTNTTDAVARQWPVLYSGGVGSCVFYKSALGLFYSTVQMT
jgi:hypothetical protein